MDSTKDVSSGGLIKDLLSNGLTKSILSAFVGKKMLDLLQSSTNRLADEIFQAFKNRISDYLEIECERNSKTKTILHRHEPIELDKFYQPLFLRKGREHWEIGMESSKSKRVPTNNVADILTGSNCVTIIGTAGSGKSTLVKYLFVNSIKTDYKIPLKVELRYLNDYNKDLLSFINEEIIKFSEIATSDGVVDRMLSAGAFIVFFDGYDEVSSAKKESVTNDICKITKKYPNNSYLLTSRPFVSVDLLENFVNYYVCDLSDDEIKSFVKKQFNDSEQELADRIIQTINDESSKTYRSFLSNPLLLSMFIITYQTDSNIPQKRSDYYNQVFNTLYSVHDTSSKLGYVREKKSGLSKESFIDILKRFSFKSYFEQKYSFSVNYFENLLNVLKKDLHLSFGNDDFIQDTEVAIGILTQEGQEITFPHRSLQEYFAALYVTTISVSNKEKVYGFLYKQFARNIRDRFERYETSNFFSLLYEMDTIGFKRQLVLPILKELKQEKERFLGAILANKNGDREMKFDLIHCFVSLFSVVQFVKSSYSGVLRNEDVKYSKKFLQYKEKMEKKFKTPHPKTKERLDIIDRAREELADKDIIPFLESFNIDVVIKEMEDGIMETENIDAGLIDSLLQG